MSATGILETLPTNRLSVIVVRRDGHELLLAVGQASAAKKRKAKDMAAKSGFEWLRSQYPLIDLNDV